MREEKFDREHSRIQYRLALWQRLGITCPCCGDVGIIHAHKARCVITGRLFWYNPMIDGVNMPERRKRAKEET